MRTIEYGLETKFCRPGEAITLTDGCRIEGYASLFGLADQGGDVVMPGAYGRSLKRLKAEGRAVRMLWQHDAGQPIGVWDEIAEDGRGLCVKGRILTEIGKGREAAALVAAGAIDGLSIGYRTVTAEKDAKGQRLLREVELWEVSLVTFPMLPEARVSAKGDTPEAAALRELAALFEEARRTLAGRA
ncbi:HK97 family phage prohead protease [Albidovulum sp.]|mgnify:FL=1|uniref:HK97 family phage prohead protease n=1 Tax=Albidovulum sp. TaxID=1872424 RepID=UPI0039B955E2